MWTRSPVQKYHSDIFLPEIWRTGKWLKLPQNFLIFFFWWWEQEPNPLDMQTRPLPTTTPLLWPTTYTYSVSPNFHWQNTFATVGRNSFHRNRTKLIASFTDVNLSRWLHLKYLARFYKRGKGSVKLAINFVIFLQNELRPAVAKVFCQWKLGDML